MARSQPKPSHFYTKVAGVSHRNDDGTQRQRIIKRCQVHEQLVLEHDPRNRHDPNAVRVCRLHGEQLGFLKADLAPDVVNRLARGFTITAFIVNLTGGTEEAPTRGVNIVVVTAAESVPSRDLNDYIDELLQKTEDSGSSSGSRPGCAVSLLLLAVIAAVCWAVA
jgi:hypothetical protein